MNLLATDRSTAARLDPSLAFAMVLDEQRDLILRTSGGGLGGLIEGIRELQTTYAAALTAAVDASKFRSDSADRLTQPAWVPASSSVRTTLSAALVSAQKGVATTIRPAATAALGVATNLTSPSSPESGLAATVATAASRVLTALGQLETGKGTLAAATAASATPDATTALAAARALRATLEAEPTPDTARIANVATLITAAEAVLDSAAKVTAAANSPLVTAAGASCTTTMLATSQPPATYLSTWSNRGTVSLTDGKGIGIVITPDGRVDAIPPSGAGWQFLSASTFVLPDGTKLGSVTYFEVTARPGSGASPAASPEAAS